MTFSVILVPFWCLRNGDIWSLVTAASIKANLTVITWKQCSHSFHIELFHINSYNYVFLVRILVFTGATLQAFANVHVGFYKRLWERLCAIFYLRGNVCAMWHHVFSSNLSQLMQLFMFASEFSAESTKSVARENKIKRCAVNPKYHFYHTLALYF